MSTNSGISIPLKIKKVTIIVVAAYLINFIGFTFLLPTMALMGKALFSGGGAAGLPITILSGIALFSALPFGKLADKIGRKISLILVVLAYGLGDVFGYFAIQNESSSLYVVAMLFLGIGVGAMALFATAVTDLYPGKYKGRASGFAQIGVMGAIALGYLIAGQLVGIYGKTSVYIVGAIAQAISIVLLIAVNPDTMVIGKNLKDYWPKEAFEDDELNHLTIETMEAAPEKNRPVWKLVLMYPFFLSLFLRISVHLGGNYVNVMLPVAFTQIGYSIAAISIFMTIRGLATLFGTYPTGHLIDKHGRKLGFIGAPLLTAVGILLIGLTGSIPFIVVGTILIGLGNSIANVIGPAVANDVTFLPERSKAMAVFGISTNVGGFIFPVPMAIILNQFGMYGLAIACSLFLAIPLVLGFILVEKSVGKYKGS